MASTYSPLKIQLMTTGENTTTWGNVTNVNLGTAIEEMVTGSSDVTFASTTVTLTLTDTNASQTARHLRLNLTGTSGGAQNLIVPAVEKVYLVNNGCADAITVKNSSGTGTAVPAGKTMWVYNDGTNVTNAITHLTSLTLAAALPVASGGTGLTSTPSNGQIDIGNGTGFTRAAITAGSGISVTNGSGTITIAATGGSGTVTSVNASGGSTGLSFSGGPITGSGTLTLAGTLAVANGGTGGTSQAAAQSALGVPSTTGSGASGNWVINVTGSSASCTGNAATATTATTATTANALNSSNSYTAVDFTATSDMRLKDVYGFITDALDKVDALNGFYYRNNDKARSLGQVKEEQQVGLSAQALQDVLPEAISRWSVDPEYLVVAYDRVIPLLVEAIKELRAEVKALKG